MSRILVKGTKELLEKSVMRSTPDDFAKVTKIAFSDVGRTMPTSISGAKIKRLTKDVWDANGKFTPSGARKMQLEIKAAGLDPLFATMGDWKNSLVKLMEKQGIESISKKVDFNRIV